MTFETDSKQMAPSPINCAMRPDRPPPHENPIPISPVRKTRSGKHSYGRAVRKVYPKHSLPAHGDRMHCIWPIVAKLERVLLWTEIPSYGELKSCLQNYRTLVSPELLLWIRDEFLYGKDDFGKIVVHGHTPVEKPEILPNRINIDTGAFITNRLTCLVIEAEQYSIIST